MSRKIKGGRNNSLRPPRGYAAIRRRLLNWYDKNKRDLPWRHREHDPYSQWVVEIMLQQTRVETVMRYYEPFLARFPNLEALAKADHQDVLKAWEGLGYYRRVLHLHRAAKELWGRRCVVPRSVEELRKLPGVGVYTAAAIASITYGDPVAAVDANVARVVGRLLGLSEISSTQARSQIQQEADRLLCLLRPGDFNQAWMDLGSSVCLPRGPRCPICPLNEYCHTASQSLVVAKAASKRKPTKHVTAVVVFKHKECVLVRQRPEGGLWSGLWEFPSADLRGPKADSTLREIEVEHGLEFPLFPRKIGVVRHQLTHKNIHFQVFEADLSKRVTAGGSSRWVSHQRFERLPVSTAHRRIYQFWMDSRLGDRTAGA